MATWTIARGYDIHKQVMHKETDVHRPYSELLWAAGMPSVIRPPTCPQGSNIDPLLATVLTADTLA